MDSATSQVIDVDEQFPSPVQRREIRCLVRKNHSGAKIHASIGAHENSTMEVIETHKPSQSMK